MQDYESSDNDEDYEEYHCNYIEIEKSGDENDEYEIYPIPVRRQPDRETKTERELISINLNQEKNENYWQIKTEE